MSSPATVWPASLPDGLLVAGLQYQPVSNATPIPVEAGEVLTRQRFTGRQVRISGALVLDAAQYQTLLDFYYDDLREVSPFAWTDPVTGANVLLVFDGVPQGQPVSTDVWRVAVNLISKPAVPGGSPA